ncbi:hypothetical protein [Streptomyces murinus]|uniref:hypothetical protein n=1 Tax=Streptomyces murinus TaxID=33900 RepID=UPI002E119D98|nr:hypothetical protein OG516_23780 [Streptomyces murinus]
MKTRFRLPAAVAAVALAAVGTMGLTSTPAAADAGTCFGYTGNFNSYGANYVDWQYGPDECFGVAPSGTMWHTWSGAGDWKEMPGGGRAEYFVGFFENSAGKSVKVVTSTGNYYCSYDDYATNTWGGWYGTSTDHC